MVEEETPIISYAVLSVGRGGKPIQLDPSGAEELHVEDVFREGAPWVPEGSKIGVVYIRTTDPHDEDQVVLSARFRFSGRNDGVTVDGSSMRDGSLLAGRLAMNGGTGRFLGRTDEVVLEEQNPKRWVIGGGG